ncbi:ribonuclease III [Chlorobium phaeovibrioides]|uniref:ribonuclease III n=1 Tax=Chlorobium phaeovibrioides TaxID=1094 RepID=UPI000F827A0E|nr:ribonuclease III [Chlorobium phaeovibrioides]RTY34465.1 ribonuclease III [Chlorobium phaeovibrioides]
MEQLWQKISALPIFSTELKTGSALTATPESIEFVSRLLGRKPGDMRFYTTALTHRSAVHDPSTPLNTHSNQRLEFLGDAILGLVITDYLFRELPDSPEGELSNTRAKIVNRKSLAGFARSIKIGDHLILGESADHAKIRVSESTLADALEAFIGAIWLDRGISAATSFINEHVIEHRRFNTLITAENNHKSRLIEHTQALHLPPPRYSVISEEGAEHEKRFTVEVSCNGKVLGKGTAARKKDAEQHAAAEAMLNPESIS